jgi:hypothetical protein
MTTITANYSVTEKFVILFTQLFLMKQGGEEIYVGPLGHHSSKLIEYFEVR